MAYNFVRVFKKPSSPYNRVWWLSCMVRKLFGFLVFFKKGVLKLSECVIEYGSLNLSIRNFSNRDIKKDIKFIENVYDDTTEDLDKLGCSRLVYNLIKDSKKTSKKTGTVVYMLGKLFNYSVSVSERKG